MWHGSRAAWCVMYAGTGSASHVWGCVRLSSSGARAVRLGVNLLSLGGWRSYLLLAWPCLRGKAGVWWSTAAVLWCCWWCSSLLEDALVHAGSENTRQPVTLAKALAQCWCLGQHSGQSRISARALSINRWSGRCSPIPSGGEWAALKTVSLLFNEMLQWCVW